MRALRVFVAVSLVCLLSAACVLSVAAVAPASAAGTVAWTVRAVAQPTRFAASDGVVCASEEKCDRYQLLVLNSGDEASPGGVSVTDRLPKGLTFRGDETGAGTGEDKGFDWGCSPSEEALKEWVVTCTFAGPVAEGAYAPSLAIEVSAPNESTSGSLRNEVSVAAGGASGVASTSESTPIATGPPAFGVSEFSMEADDANGEADLRAGGHPWEVTASFAIPLVDTPPGIREYFEPVENVKKAIVELPLGMVGDPLAAERCSETQLSGQDCPAGSEVGSFAVTGGSFSSGEYRFTGTGASGVYDMVAEGGYPAEFAVTFAGVPVYPYATVVHSASGERLRITVPGVPSELGTDAVAITLWGEPGLLNGSGSEAAFVTNPTDCDGAGKARIELESWEDPGHSVSREATVYPHVTGCDLLQSAFVPSLEVQPSGEGEGGTTEADAPSAYTAELKAPQSSGFQELATPELNTATVTLPAGVSISPSAAQGLVGCQETGPEGINIGSGEIGPGGQDLGDPEATEFGAGLGGPGGNDSPYDDGQYHTAPGHCPEASTVGSVEIVSPMVSSPLHGHLYLAEPRCGGEGRQACTEADATNGVLYSGYVEAQGSGVIVKIPGKLSANPRTGQLTASFEDSPQFPFSELKLRLHGGPRALLANPQTCGSFAASSTLTSWAEQEVSQTAPAFSVDWDGNGGAGGRECPSFPPFNPSFTAGTIAPTAGAYSPLTLTISRQDSEQDLSGFTFTTPPGLLATLSNVPACAEPQAAQGECGQASEVGTATVAAGAGSEPIYLSGHVYLTGPYDGQPFGLSIVIPAAVGPFHLGDVSIRASVAVNPTTLALTIATNPGVGGIPIIEDGIPLRLRTINVDIDRPEFIFNPTNCDEQQIGASISSAQGASVSSPFAVGGCKNLPFSPKLTASTEAHAEALKGGSGASLNVKIASRGGPGASGEEANIRRLDVTLPKLLPARLQPTLQNACTEARFAKDPADCPPDSFVGTATALTPVFDVPLTGPAIFVSHGGASLPDLDLVLQGEGVEILLTGHTDIEGDVTYSKFETFPDVPISSFALTLPQGPHSALASGLPTNKHSLCGQSLQMGTTIEGQNGAVLNQVIKVRIEGCKPALYIRSIKVSGTSVTVTVTVPSAGKIVASGAGLSGQTKRPGGEKLVTLKLTLNGTQAAKVSNQHKLTIRVRLAFTPKRGMKLKKGVGVRFG